MPTMLCSCNHPVFMYSIRLLAPVLLLLSPVVQTQAQQVSQPIIRYDAIHHPVSALEGMVVSQNVLSSRVGAKILEQGGNATDAAVATAFSLAVTLPRAGNLGGSGFALIYDSNQHKASALDFRSVAPQNAKVEQFRNAEGRIDWPSLTFGPKAAAVPGTIAGLYMAWQQHGSMAWKDLVQPAIDQAKNGITVSEDLAFALGEAQGALKLHPHSWQNYSNEGRPFQQGDLFKQPDLAWSLTQIRDGGADAFYLGAIAQKFAESMQTHGGLISLKDLSQYQVKHRNPIATEYRGNRVITMPPSSGGGLALLQMLNVLSEFDLQALPQGSSQSLHVLAEVMKRVNANRRLQENGIGDPDFVDVPVKGFLSKELAKQIALGISMTKATATTELEPLDPQPYESHDTTHLSVVDADGNAVSLTYTLGYSFGSAFVVEGTGILLDNQMRNFSLRNPQHANALAPGKRMVSTMTPTLVFDTNNELFMVTGTPGGSLIHTSLLQLLVNVIDYGLNIAEATSRPRIYQAWRKPELTYEDGINEDTLKALEAKGHILLKQKNMGSTQSILISGDKLLGSADPRRPNAGAVGVNLSNAPNPL